MIYLIDDNQHNQRFNNYNITFIEEGTFDGYLTSIEKLEAKNSISDTSHLEFLKNADCIFLHSTTEDYDKDKGFLSGSTKNAKNIKEEIAKWGELIPLVLFSNTLSMNEVEYSYESNPNYISSIKKNLFYERLYDFMEYYKNTNKVELRIIAWGKNFIREEISKLAIEILQALDSKKASDILLLSDLSKVLKSLKSFIELSFSSENLNEILNDIEDNPLEVKGFKKKINQITESFSKYGKNIYSWK